MRAIFRECIKRYRQGAIPGLRGLTLSRGLTWGRKNEEYRADICLVAGRTLDDMDWEIFHKHFLGGQDWRACCRRLGINRGIFFHAVYRVEQRLGRAWREVRPYVVHPLDEYFGTHDVLNPAAWMQRPRDD